MIDLTYAAVEYTESTLHAVLRCREILLDYARTRGYTIHQPQLHTCYGGSPQMHFNLCAIDDPGYWFSVSAVATSMRYFSSDRSSHRGNIRVSLMGFDNFLDEMDKRKKEWVKQGRKNALQRT